MKNTRFMFFSFFIALSVYSYAQKAAISGYIRDAENGEALIGANIYSPELNIGSGANQYGFFSLTLPAGTYNLRISYVGYETKDTSLSLQENTKVNFELKPQSFSTEAVVVTGKAEDKNIKSVEMGTLNISPAEIRQVPVIFGEQDIMKTVQLMPGVTAAGEGNSGFYVRGGGIDQNLILLDEAPVYNATHILGFFSVFNSDAINNVKLIKGSGPVEYGGRLSSVFDIKMKEGNSKNFGASGGIGLVSSRLALEGPITEGKGSFLVSARRTYADLIMKAANPNNFDGLQLYFYDINIKANYSLDEKNNIYLSGYLGRDVLGLRKKFGLDWGNTTATLRWNHIFSNQIFSNTSFIYSDFDYTVSTFSGGNMTDIASGIEDFNLKNNLFWSLNPQNKLTVGFDANYHTFTPGEVSASKGSSINNTDVEKKYALESSAYIGHEWEITQMFSVNYGLRYSAFSWFGPGTVYRFADNEEIISENKYSSGEVIKTYSGLEPRIAANILIDVNSSAKLSYTRAQQSIHLISNSGSRMSMDVWHPSTVIVKPGIADQVSVGYFRNFADNQYESSIEFYYKKMQNLVDYKEGADILLNPYIESQLVFGEGKSYGMEMFVKKNFGRLNGWLGYTLARTERDFEQINDGKPYPAKNDRTHDISLVLMYRLNEKWEISANWVYYTGQAVTFPSGKYMIDGQTINYFTDRNAYRMPDYHRLDLSATYTFSKKGRFESGLNFSLYNAYGQKNPYVIYFRENEHNPEITEAVKVYLFTFFPSITFNFKW